MRLQTMSMLDLHHNAKLLILQVCFPQPQTATYDDDFLDLSHGDIFFQGTRQPWQHAFSEIVTYEGVVGGGLDEQELRLEVVHESEYCN